MALYGNISEFDDAVEDWAQYTERLGHYFEANGIGDVGKQKAILLSVCGGKTYGLMRNLLAPVKPGAKTFKQLVDLVGGHYNPRPSVIVQRYKFHTRVRKGAESINEFVAELRKLTEFCEFGPTLEDMLRDRLVCGINEDRILRRLLAEPDLKFNRALEIATSMETAEKNTSDLRQSMKSGNSSDSVSMHQLRVQKGQGHTGRPTSRGSGGFHGESRQCHRCGGRHDPSGCYYKDAECYVCGQFGHISSKCRNTQKYRQQNSRGRQFHRGQRARRGGRQAHFSRVDTERKTHFLDSFEDESENIDRGQQISHLHLHEEDNHREYALFKIGGKSSNPYTVQLHVNRQPLKMEIDTGAAATVIGAETWNYIRQGSQEVQLVQTHDSFKTYTGEQIPVLGKTHVHVDCLGQEANLPLHVTQGNGPNLLGRDWLDVISVDWKEIRHIHMDDSSRKLQDILNNHSTVFKLGLGTFSGVKAKIYVDQNVKPCYFKARPVPYALKGKIEDELERLQKEGTIELVDFSDWAAPIVPVVKGDSSIRICGDYKLTVNKHSKLDNYPIPKTDDLYATLGGGECFTKLDLSQAYQQIVLEDNSKQYVTINTHKGLFQYNRLPFGVSSAPGIFQRSMENLLQGIPNVVVRVDDILVGGHSKSAHLSTLDVVLERIAKAGLRLKREKCQFMVSEVTYLGYRIDREGLHPLKDKVQAIRDAPPPKSVSELKSYLGILNYYGRFIRNLSTLLAPLHKLLRKGCAWSWGDEQQRAFELSKSQLCSTNVLVHFDENKELILSCDASPYGVGAVLSHWMADGADRPIGFVSRTLNSAEQKYAHLEKEGLAIIFGVKKISPVFVW